jgi:hypothetical protein
MASGHVNRANRPNTWLLRPMLQTVKKALANPEVAVGTRITPRPPHRSRRALLTHRALALDGDEEPLFRPRMQDARHWQVVVGNSLHSRPRQPASLTTAHESTVPAFD